MKNWYISALFIVICLVYPINLSLATGSVSPSFTTAGQWAFNSGGTASVLNTLTTEEYFFSVKRRIQKMLDEDKVLVETMPSPQIKFTILPNGQLRDAIISRSSSNTALDAKILASFNEAAPLPWVGTFHPNEGLYLEADFTGENANHPHNEFLKVHWDIIKYLEIAINQLEDPVVIGLSDQDHKIRLVDKYVDKAQLIKIYSNDLSYLENNQNNNSDLLLGLYKKAVKDYTKLIVLNPNNIDAYGLRGLAYACLGDNESAKKDYLIAISLINP